MSAAEERDEQFLDHRVLSDDDLAQLGLEVVITLLKLGDGFQLVGPQVGLLRLNNSDLLLLPLLLLCHAHFLRRRDEVAGKRVLVVADNEYSMPAEPKPRTRPLA